MEEFRWWNPLTYGSVAKRGIQALYDVFSEARDIIKTLGGALWLIVKSAWPLLVLLAGMLQAMLSYFADAIDWATLHMDATFAALSDANDSMQAIVAAGWPPQLAQAVNYLNQYIPLSLIVTCFVTLVSAWSIMGVVRLARFITVIFK